MTPGPNAKPFWDQVDVAMDPKKCWEWTGTLFRNGYGRACVDRKSVGAHRRSWELLNGPIPDGMYVCHSCDNRKCVRPGHLFLGTPAENMQDMVDKGRSLSGSRNHNSKLTETEVVEIRERYAAGGITQAELARQYGVVEGCIWNVIHNRVFREVAA